MTEENHHRRITDNVENCSKIFVSWNWAVSFIIGFIVIISGVAWATSAAYTTIKNLQEIQELEILHLKSIYNDIDTVKIILRQNHELLKVGKYAD